MTFEEQMIKIDPIIENRAKRYVEIYGDSLGDLLQEGRFAAWKAWLSFDKSLSNFKTWALAKANWAMLDWVYDKSHSISCRINKREIKKRVWFPTDTINLTDESGESIEDEPWSMDRYKPFVCYTDLYDALDKIDDMKRRLLLLYYFQGNSLKEIGKQFNFSESYACLLLKDAKEDLKKELTE